MSPANSLANAFWKGVIYFVLVFAAGFVLGIIRVLVFVPKFGERASEIGELPLMIVITVLAARQVVKRLNAGGNHMARLVVGLTGFALLVMAEILVALFVRQQSLYQYVSERDPLAGALYLVSLVIFASAPWLVGALSRTEQGNTG